MTTANDVRFWDKSAKRYAQSAIADLKGYERTLERTRAFLQPGHEVLELGCGTGTTALRLAEGVKSYLATDISREMIAIANEKLLTDMVPHLTFRTATADDLKREEDRFDIILGFNYLHLVRDAPGTLRALHSLLKPRGLFISKTPCVGEMNLLVRRVLLPIMRSLGKAPHVTIFDAPTLEHLLAEEGFTVVANEAHASKGRDARPFFVARKQ